MYKYFELKVMNADWLNIVRLINDCESIVHVLGNQIYIIHAQVIYNTNSHVLAIEYSSI